MSLVFEVLDTYFENQEKKEKQELLDKIKKGTRCITVYPYPKELEKVTC